MSTVEQVREAALILTEIERALFVQDFVESLHSPTEEREWAEAWADEILERYDEYRRGEVTPIDGEECMRQLRAELHGNRP